MRNEKFGFLLSACLLAIAAALAVSFATGSHVQFGNADGSFRFDLKVGAAANGLTLALGMIAVIAFVAALAVYQSESEDSTREASGGGDGPGGGSPSLGRATTFLRQLTKSKGDVWLGGVCGGLGQHTPLPAWVWRLLFLSLGIFYGTGVLAYVLLWICLPEPPKADPNPPTAPPQA